MSATVDIAPPLTLKQAAKALNVSERTITRIAGLEFLEYQGAGRRRIKRVTAESVRRLLEGERDE